MKLYMFRGVPLSIIRSLFTVHSALVYAIQVCRQLSSWTRLELQFHPGQLSSRTRLELHFHLRQLSSWTRLELQFHPGQLSSRTRLELQFHPRQLSSRTRLELQFHPGPARKLSTNLYDIYQCRVYSE